jgi:hypothetical protein
MGTSEFHFCVIGIGHLAAALRVQLRACQLSNEGDWDGSNETPPVLIACSDYESASSLASAQLGAIDDRPVIFLVWLSAKGVSVAPLLVPLETSCESTLARRWDFSLSDTPCRFVSAEHALRQRAQIGAEVVARRLRSFHLTPGARGASGV